MEQLDGLREAIWKLLEKQLLARAVASRSRVRVRGQGSGAAVGSRDHAQSSKSPNLAGPHPNPLQRERGPIVADVRTRQIEIQKQTADLAKSIGSTDRKERLTTKRVLSGLAFGEMVEAVALCDALLKGDVPPAAKQDRADVPSAAKQNGRSTAERDAESTAKRDGKKDRLAAAGTAASAVASQHD